MNQRIAFERGEVPVALSGWTKPQGTAREWPMLTGDSAADAVVIGAGLAGSSLALHLAEAGVDVVAKTHQRPLCTHTPPPNTTSSGPSHISRYACTYPAAATGSMP